MAIRGKSGSARTAALMLLLAPLILLLSTACGDGNSGFPRQAGQYAIQPGTLSYDGKKYMLQWAEAGGALHWAEGPNVRMQRDERTFLEIGNGSPIVHLKEDEGITVRGRDRDGEFTSQWFPFFLGYGLGGGFGGGTINRPYPGDSPSRGPSYQYPPTDTFGRGDQMNGSVERSKPQPPDYSKVPPAPYAVSGQSGGTGGGNAATNKATGPTSGQSGGSGSGSAASGKGTFSSSGSTGNGGTGVGGGSGWTSGSRPPTGTGSASGGSSTGSGGAATGRSSVPSRPSGGGRR